MKNKLPTYPKEKKENLKSSRFTIEEMKSEIISEIQEQGLKLEAMLESLKNEISLNKIEKTQQLTRVHAVIAGYRRYK